MDQSAISAQTTAAIADLTQQLESLRQQQAALLDSLTTTSDALTDLPAYSHVAPTLAQIPVYEAKLARLKATMNTQTNAMGNLRRRAENTRNLRMRNLERIKERRAKDREEDRTIYKARVVGEERVPTPTPAAVTEGNGSAAGESESTPSTPPAAAVVKTVKRKKKVRQVQMD